jgi:EAL domain-containing protein (putative c-di-GMP-specific phosphodiesterase class I)
MQLIRGVDQDPYKAEVARMLLTMARNLGVLTVAEGIETEAEWHWFREHGADYVQGYFFARPGSPPPTPYERV